MIVALRIVAVTALSLSITTLAHADKAIALVDLDGKPVAFSTVQRDATVVAMWSVACVPCIEEMPMLQALAQKLTGDARATVLGINVDGVAQAAKARQIIAAKKVTYPILFDPAGALRHKWLGEEPLSLPTLLAFDRKWHALVSQGFFPGESADGFVADWLPRISSIEAGKLSKHLTRVETRHDQPATEAQMAAMIDKMVRSHHPELDDAAVKKRVDQALEQMRKTGNFSIE